MAADKLVQEMSDLAAKGNVKGMLDFAEGKELEVADAKAFDAAFFNMVALGNLIQGDFVSARFALRRAGLCGVKDAKETQKVAELTRALWNHQDAAALSILSSFDFHGLGKLLLQAIIARAIAGFANSYTAATTAMVAKHLGVQETVVKGIVPVVDTVHCDTTGVLTTVGEGKGDPLSKEAVQLLADSAVLLRQPYE